MASMVSCHCARVRRDDTAICKLWQVPQTRSKTGLAASGCCAPLLTAMARAKNARAAQPPGAEIAAPPHGTQSALMIIDHTVSERRNWNAFNSPDYLFAFQTTIQSM